MGKRKQKSTSFPHRFLIAWLLAPIRLEKGRILNFTVSLLLFSIKANARATCEDCQWTVAVDIISLITTKMKSLPFFLHFCLQYLFISLKRFASYSLYRISLVIFLKHGDEPMTLTARIHVRIDQKSSQEKKQNTTTQEF